MSNKTATTETPPITIQRTVHDGYITISREIKIPHKNKEYTSNSCVITVSRPTMEEVMTEFAILKEHMLQELELAPTTQAKELEELKARLEHVNVFIKKMMDDEIIGTIFTREINKFKSSPTTLGTSQQTAATETQHS